ncbi:type IV toxin-antitoxin system AbiEi family antitoxin domain-containing protein [Microlunatus capsulatus]|uniref:Transcriptional regulator, AbiEi antitoxin, Type IV TA system n=1 Tax=Microlunatus capsulatus TaxID=99117 RepID=A0ABS4Z579_9ACTN|nr:type IV toxin-antitoxin system AbiEi family antitoxin domain-containing protein [Microlunatus capsulatus]MBP2415872.1 hypothetical protein [Microlunatus capsulatus]
MDPLPDVRLARDLVADGRAYNELGRLVRRGELEHLRRGAYALPGADPGPDAQHRRMVHATLPLLDGGVVSHRSAGVLHGLPLPPDASALVDVTRADATSGRRRGHVHRWAAPLLADEVVAVDGLPVTDLARTVVDLGRTLPFADAVAVADAALHRGLHPDALAAAVERARGRPGVADARRVVSFADGRSESAGESHSRVVLHRLGLPRPELQLEVRDPGGRLLGRCDFGWEEHRTVGEFDGRTKYGRLLRPGQTPEDAVWAEKRREDLLRDEGWQVVRWCWADLWQPALLGQRLHRAFRRQRR